MNVIKTPLADKLGLLLAQKSDIVEQSDTIKADLITRSVNESCNVLEGELFRVTVSYVDRNVIDYKAVLEQLIKNFGVSAGIVGELIAANTKTAEGEPRVRCAARK